MSKGGVGGSVRACGESGTHVGEGVDEDEERVGVFAHTQRREDGQRDGGVEGANTDCGRQLEPCELGGESTAKPLMETIKPR
ncbi:hypothetical protein K439DRAFT_1641513 [Ramaria rubella]|nr:hypothetical protein K439DRAFT_1641513 [Ramaria rubella]